MYVCIYAEVRHIRLLSLLPCNLQVVCNFQKVPSRLSDILNSGKVFEIVPGLGVVSLMLENC